MIVSCCVVCCSSTSYYRHCCVRMPMLFNRVILLFCLERVISLVVSINRVWSPDTQRTKSLCNILTVKKIDIRRKCVHKFPFWDLRWTIIAHRNRRLPTSNHVHLHMEWCPVCKQNQFIFLHFVQFIRCPCCYCWYSSRSGRWWVFPFTSVMRALQIPASHHTMNGWMLDVPRLANFTLN